MQVISSDVISKLKLRAAARERLARGRLQRGEA